MTSAMKELLVQLAPALIRVTSAPPLTSESVLAIVMETGSMSTPAKPAPITVNLTTDKSKSLKDLIHHIIDHFFSMMTYCTEQVLSACTPFEFVWSLLENHSRTSKKSGVSDKLRCIRRHGAIGILRSRLAESQRC